jgi:hypothetical protein
MTSSDENRDELGKEARRGLLFSVPQPTQVHYESSNTSPSPYTQALKLPFQFFKRVSFRQAGRLIDAPVM